MRLALLLTLLAVTPAAAGVTVEVRVADGVPHPAPGRVVVAFAKGAGRPTFTEAGPREPSIVFGVPAPGLPVTLDDRAAGFPPGTTLGNLPPGDYRAQAMLVNNLAVNRPDPAGPGNLLSEVTAVKVEAGGTKVTLTLQAPAVRKPPAETAATKFEEFESKLLTAFHGRPMAHRVGVVLPKDFAAGDAKYGLVVHVGGFGQRYTGTRGIAPDPRFVQILLDGAGPFGDPYHVDSANNGPYGQALVAEVIPYIEKKYRCLGTPQSRFTTGGSTGGWVSLALQVFYPDVFNGCWSQCPDGVDFRAFQLIDITRDSNAYVNRYGFERPARRTVAGETVYTVRHEASLERVLGGGRWELGAQQWASWNAVYGPKGKDGPVPLWDGVTGVIDKSVVPHWEKYDLRLILERGWPTLGPKLAGKIHVWVGDADDYFLNNGVHLLKESLAKARNPAFDGVIEIAPRQGHTSGWGRERVLTEMAARLPKP